ncbi:MAG: hypothetical protein IIW40_05015, partial [Clostridia bacterium]|nr:hypothetical protein [Clostridia bacterium]
TYSMTFPFAVANPMVQSQVGAYGWNIARPLYEAVGERGMSVTLYPRTDVGGSSYIINIHVIGNWK